MYLCNNCKKSTKSRESLNLFIEKRRNREYYIGILKHKRSDFKTVVYKRPTQEELNKWKQENLELSSERVTKGWEIEKELKLCNKCFSLKATQEESNI